MTDEANRDVVSAILYCATHRLHFAAANGCTFCRDEPQGRYDLIAKQSCRTGIDARCGRGRSDAR